MPDPKSFRSQTNATARASKQAKQLRRELSPPERKLWHALKAKKLNNLHFRKQHPLGPYIADFYCHAPRLVVEVDGNQHQGDQLKHDQHRDQWMQSQGLNILRVHARDVFTNLQGVVNTIERTAEDCIAQRNRDKDTKN
ncbi:MAG: endonuclease domain-containing protein [Phycisphaerales bacterium]|nr:endonuclease domain-containing protein [Phycisphaerales bacterium]